MITKPLFMTLFLYVPKSIKSWIASQRQEMNQNKSCVQTMETCSVLRVFDCLLSCAKCLLIIKYA